MASPQLGRRAEGVLAVEGCKADNDKKGPDYPLSPRIVNKNGVIFTNLLDVSQNSIFNVGKMPKSLILNPFSWTIMPHSDELTPCVRVCVPKAPL